MADRNDSQSGTGWGGKDSSLSSLARYRAEAMPCWVFCSSYSLRRATIGADTNIQFSEPQLEQIRCAEEETAKARLVSQSAHKTIRFSNSLARLMSPKLIFEPLSNLSHVVLLIVFLHSARRFAEVFALPGESAKRGSRRVSAALSGWSLSFDYTCLYFTVILHG